MKKFLILVIFGVISLCMALQPVNVSDYYWLDIVPDGRAMGMGAAQMSNATGAFAGYYNPACLIGQKNLALSGTSLYGAAQSINLGYTDSLGLGTLGLSAYILSMSGIKTTAYVDGRPVDLGADTEMRNIVAMLSHAVKIGAVDVGINLKYLNSKIVTSTGSGWGIDFGWRYNWERLYIGGVFNGPIAMDWPNTREVSPAKSKIGAGLYLLDNLLIVTDFSLYGYGENMTSIGIEYNLFKSLYLRAGASKYFYNAGIGLQLAGMNLDVAYTSAAPDYSYMESSFRASMGYNW